MNRTLLAATALSLVSSLALAAADPSDTCRSGKQAAAAKYVACRAKADRKFNLGSPSGTRDAMLGKCAANLAAAWTRLEEKALASGGSCPRTDDEALVENLAEVHARRVHLEVSGEQRFVDNGDGTLSDRRTGLMWEKKNLSASPDQFFTNPHGAGVPYRWAAGCGSLNGCQVEPAASATCTAQAVGAPLACGMCDLLCEVDPFIASAYTAWGFLNRMNAGAFAGHDDWRIPTLEELRTLLDLSHSGNAVEPAFRTPACDSNCTDETDEACSCNNPGWYLTSSVAATDYPTPYSRVWVVSFSNGAVTTENTWSTVRVRLVRGQCFGAASGGCG